MHSNLKIKLAALTATVALLGVSAAVASGATGAYFSDTQPGTITGTVGCIKVTASGGTANGHGSGQDFSFNALLPGAPQVITIGYQNSCTSTQDVWLTFPNATALSALNNLGRYGTIHIASTGTGAVGPEFDYANLNDRVPTCGPFSPSGCWPLPSQLKVAGNVGPTASGQATFSFMYASAVSDPAAEGTSWNVYPVAAGLYNPPGNTNGQFVVNPGDGTGSGLPYAVVATQLGITPGAVGTRP